VGGIWGQTRNLDDRALGPVDLSKGRAGRPKPAGRLDMGTDTMSDIPFPSSINRGANSKKSRTATATGKTTPENQGSNLSAIRDRHDIWVPEFLTGRTWPSAGSSGPSRLWRPDMGRDTMSDIPIRNV